ncbi:MAG: hypothetical protein KAU02_05915 [Tenericutes bacterium]|nr:hypothetical protein [Mycoplasmatota bacterium]
MLNLIVAVSLWAFWISFVGLSIILLFMRTGKAIYDKQTLKDSLFIIFLPCSIGLYIKYKEKSVFKLYYQILVIIQFVLMLLGSIMVFYIHFG